MSTIQILTPTEIRNYESPPRFDSFSRKKFFALPTSLVKEVETLRTDSGKIAFILQAGYFRSVNRFFGNRFYEEDIAYVAGRLFLPNPAALEVPKQNLARNRRIIAEFYGFRRLTKNDKDQLTLKISDLVKHFTRPAEVFRQILKKLNNRKFILPGYDFLSTNISREVYRRKLYLSRIINESLSAEQKQLFDSLLEKEEIPPQTNSDTNSEDNKLGFRAKLTLLKNPSQSLKPADIKSNLNYLTQKLTELDTQNEKQELLETFKNSSIITWQHINFHGEYDFSEEKTRDSIGFDLPKILSFKLEENGK